MSRIRREYTLHHNEVLSFVEGGEDHDIHRKSIEERKECKHEFRKRSGSYNSFNGWPNVCKHCGALKR